MSDKKKDIFEFESESLFEEALKKIGYEKEIQKIKEKEEFEKLVKAKKEIEQKEKEGQSNKGYEVKDKYFVNVPVAPFPKYGLYAPITFPNTWPLWDEPKKEVRCFHCGEIIDIYTEDMPYYMIKYVPTKKERKEGMKEKIKRFHVDCYQEIAGDVYT